MDVILSLLLNQNLLFFEVKIIIPGDIFRVNKGLFINDMSLTSSLEGQGGKFQTFHVTFALRMSLKDVRGCSIRASCKVLPFYLVILPPLHINK